MFIFSLVHAVCIARYFGHRSTYMQPVPIAAISSFPPPLHPFNRMYRVRGSGLETTKDSMRQCSLVLVPKSPLSPSCTSYLSVSPSFFSLFPSFSLLTFLLLLSIHPPPPAPLLLSYRRRRRPYVWFWAQMALACLWRRIKPPVSPFASMCKWSGQRTSNRGKGGRNAMEKKKRNSRTVKQHPTLMFHGIPRRVNSNACKNCQPAFLLLLVPCHFMNQVMTFFGVTSWS